MLTSIPLSILAAVTVLGLLGHTLDLMTLGGLGLPIGLPVDNALLVSLSSSATVQTRLVGDRPGTDLGAVQAGVEALLAEMRPSLKPGNRVVTGGQAAAMEGAYPELAGGLASAVLLIYLLMVVNFQSWALPLASLGALPLAVAGAGAGLGLAATGTPLSVPALMGVIMVVGVSTAYSVLVVGFARDRMAEGADAARAALDAIATRMRPVPMTATAMLTGMLPMALAFSEGGEQNAPLARAAIGGLLLGTAGTLPAVPLLFTLLRREPGRGNSRPPEPAVALSAE